MQMVFPTKEIHRKLMKGLLDLIVLEYLNAEPTHGYDIIIKLRKNFNVYFGPSTIYPLLNSLEKHGLVKSEWDMNNGKPRKVYWLTDDGRDFLECSEQSLILISRKLGVEDSEVVQIVP